MSLVKGTKALKAAKKYTEVSVWKGRFTADWESAAGSYREASKFLSAAGEAGRTDYMEALKGCGYASEKIEDGHTAATSYEKLADLILKGAGAGVDKKTASEASGYYQKASKNYHLQQSIDKACNCLFKAGQGMFNAEDEESGTQLWLESLEFMEHGAPVSATDIFKKIIMESVKACRWPDAILYLNKYIGFGLREMGPHEQDCYKSALALTVIYFHLQEYGKAQEEHSTNMATIGSYAATNECAAAEDIFDAFRAASQEDLTQACKATVITYLWTPVARLAKALKLSQEVIKRGPIDPDDFEIVDDGDEDSDGIPDVA